MAEKFDPKKHSNKNLVVFGIFKSRAHLENVLEELRSCGFRSADISALLPTKESTKEFAHTKETKAPEGATAGAASGAVLGGALGWLVGAGALTITGLGVLVAAGPIVSLLAGVGVGSTLGGLTGALIGLGVPEYEAKRYEGRVKNGGMLISVHCDNADWATRAQEILEREGATDISSTSESPSDEPRQVEKQKPYSATGRL